MAEFSPRMVGLKVGLEIHQQLATGRKLFCDCRQVESDEYLTKFQRRLRASKSEMGKYDAAVLFEKSKSKTIIYYGNPQSSCLVEQDEEPPHELDSDAKEISLVIASALKSGIFSEIYPMRKTVVDGSNTTGFQRTMLVAQGGYFMAGDKRIGIQSVCLEEDAAKILGDEGNTRRYSLERLGIPLVEIATEPFETSPGEVKNIALSLGRILRSTRKVRRGIGSIRQDVNISIREGGVVIEVKGVQQLDQLEKVVEYEARRQYGMLQISRGLKDKKFAVRPERIDVTGTARSWDSKIVKNAIEKGHETSLMNFEGMAGMFGMEYVPGIRLGRDIAEMVRFFGLGGIFHSDELPAYGISQKDVDCLRKEYGIDDGDAFLLLASPPAISDILADRIFSRMVEIRGDGIPTDTRMATQDGETRFLRPRPGSARMYPETDIPPIIVSSEEMEQAVRNIPKSWDESVRELQEKFKINSQLAEQVFDSRYMELFEEIVRRTCTSPTFVASILCSSITSMERDGLDSGLLDDDQIIKAFGFLEDEKITKESIEMIFGDIMAGKSSTVEEAMKNTSIKTIGQEELEEIIGGIVDRNMEIVDSQRERAMGPLMGIAMKELRGRASGEAVSRILARKIRENTT